jgi:membrane-bound serine protease (ClpP class)
MDPWFLAVLLLLLSMVLLFAEVLIPSGGLLFFGSMVALGCALWSAWGAWWQSNPVMFWSFVMGALVLLPASVGAAIQVWPHTPMGKMLEPPTNEEVTPFAAEQLRLSNLIGKFGVTDTPLNPAGMLLIAGERVHCFSEGQIVESGVRVRVLAIQGNRLMVRAATAKEQSTEEPEIPAIARTAKLEHPVNRLVADGDFDFDLPSDKASR